MSNEGKLVVALTLGLVATLLGGLHDGNLVTISGRPMLVESIDDLGAAVGGTRSRFDHPTMPACLRDLTVSSRRGPAAS